jgi:hypothetical protein
MSTRILSFRPQTARSVAQRAKSLEDFGLNVRDWLHELRRVTTRESLRRACWHAPRRMAEAFAEGTVADAFLAAQVEYLLRRAGMEAPRWVADRGHVLSEPWFPHANANSHLRALLMRDAQVEFANRNLFTTSEFTWSPKRGRPVVLTQEQRRTKARGRLHRWRARQAPTAGGAESRR